MNIFYDFNKILSYNAFLNIIIGERGVGKTYGSKKYVINRFLKKGKQFVYIRRYETDLMESVGSTEDNKFFEQIKSEFPDHTFEIRKSKKVRKLIIDKNIIARYFIFFILSPINIYVFIYFIIIILYNNGDLGWFYEYCRIFS